MLNCLFVILARMSAGIMFHNIVPEYDTLSLNNSMFGSGIIKFNEFDDLMFLLKYVLY